MQPFLILLRAIGPRHRRQLLLTLAVMLAGAAGELLTIGATLPFLTVLTGQRGLASRQLPDWLMIEGRPFVSVALLLVGAALFAAATRLLLVWLSQRFVMSVGHDVAIRIFSRMLRQPYAEFVHRNSSEVLAGMEKVRDLVGAILQPTMQGLIATVLALCIAALLFAINPFAATIAGSSVAAVYVAVSLATRRRLRSNGRILAETSVSRTKIVQEGLGGMRDIILERSQPLFEAKFAAIDLRFREALSSNVFLSTAPRFVIEAAGIVTIALVAVAMSLERGGILESIPVLGALALGAQRLLPLLQQVYNGWSLALGNFQALKDVLSLLETPVTGTREPENEAEGFERDISFRDVGFRYPTGGFALRGVTLNIQHGARIGVVGTTGSGKSTLLDLLMGLLEPSEGEIAIDGAPLTDATRAAWQTQLAHVPQSIYLADDSIAANIAFGTPAHRIDRARIEAAGRAARLEPFIAGLELGYDTMVGERGIRLSGGQRQRIGIARALYKNASVLILDEATSALDDETEADVIESIMSVGRDITLIMIAHRRTTLAGCDRLLRVERGRVHEADPADLKAPRPAAQRTPARPRRGSGGGT